MPKKQKVRIAVMAVGMLILMSVGIALMVRLHALRGLELSEALPVSQKYQIQQEIDRVADAYRELYITAEKLEPEYSGGAQRMRRADLDAFEDRLSEEGFAVVDSDEIYPAYLANPETLYTFWDAVSSGKEAEQTLIQVNADGGFTHLFFSCKGEERYMVLTELCWDREDKLYVRESELLPIYDMELTEWGIFYYQNYPDDPHYINYNQLRLEPVNRELYDLNQKYIQCVGYQFKNLFLCDWSEEDFGELCFNDLLEALYLNKTGNSLDWEKYPSRAEPLRFQIPAAVFEQTILPYFQIPLQKFRNMGCYDAKENCYPWRPLLGDDVTTWKYPMCEPEVVSCTHNGDGTMTLSVKVYSPELKTDRLFAHEVTVRPMENGEFQYVANHITYVSGYGLPPSMPRFALDGE